MVDLPRFRIIDSGAIGADVNGARCSLVERPDPSACLARPVSALTLVQ